MKIAAIALAQHALLVMANERDFAKVPGLRIDNGEGEECPSPLLTTGALETARRLVLVQIALALTAGRVYRRARNLPGRPSVWIEETSSSGVGSWTRVQYVEWASSPF